MQINAKLRFGKLFTHEGGPATRNGAAEQLRRSVMATLLWEDGFYEDGEAIAARIQRLTREVGAETAAAILHESKFGQKLRHAPLWMAVAMARSGWLSKDQLAEVITRADDLTEFLALYWADGRCPLDHQVRKGLAIAFACFDEYQLAKYDRDRAVKLRDVLRLVRPKPRDDEQSALWRRVVKGNLQSPDTWETALSAGGDKRDSFERLIREGKLGDLAFIRNLRNMVQVGVDRDLIRKSFAQRQWKWLLPFQFVTAARQVPALEPLIELAMLRSLAGMDCLPGKVTILVDGSGSMAEKLSAKSDMTRFDAACGLAILARELCGDVEVYRFNDVAQLVSARRGFALRDALGAANGGTRMWEAIRTAGKGPKRNLVIVITDEQTSDSGDGRDANAELLAVVNVSPNQNGVAYGKGIIHISGWSENVIAYLRDFVKMYHA